MNWRNVNLIFRREVFDQLRDRRTLFMIAVLPMLLYPALGVGMMQLALLPAEQPQTVVVIGAEELPPPPLFDGDRFAAEWFTQPADADKLEVVRDDVSPADLAEDAAALREQRLAAAREAQGLLAERPGLEAALAEARLTDDLGVEQRIQDELTPIRAPLGELLSRNKIQVLIIVPRAFGENVARLSERVGRGTPQDRDQEEFDYPRPFLIRNSADEKSLVAFKRVRDALRRWERELLAQQLEKLGLPRTLPAPINPESIDLAEQEQISASLWSKLFPALLVLMAVTGAFYPAIDLGAGEKERGTMETLLICPASRTEIVIGKFLTVMLFSMSTAALNLLSLGFTSKYMMSLAGATMSSMGDVSLPTPLSLLWVAVFLVPLASLFSALCLALATFARSNKEGQYYLTPLLLITLGLTMFCLSSTVEINPFYSVLPIMGPALLLKGLLVSGGTDSSLYIYTVPVLITSFGYSALALWWAIEQFASEDVLFREAERFELRLWLQHLLRDKERTPSFAEAAFCFVLIMLLQFVAMRFMQAPLRAADPTSYETVMIKLLIVQQLVIIATPALIMGTMLTTSLSQTFRLRSAGPQLLAVAGLLALALHPLTLELAAHLHWFFPPLPESVQSALAAMSSGEQPLWVVLLAFAVAPGICEELAYRGFILSGFARRGRVGIAVVLSSLMFGLMHMIPQQVFNASLVGLVLGLIAVRGKSLWPCILFHVIYNSLFVLRERAGATVVTEGSWLFWLDQGALRYRALTLAVCAAAAVWLIFWLWKLDRSQPVESDADESAARAHEQVDDEQPVEVG